MSWLGWIVVAVVAYFVWRKLRGRPPAASAARHDPPPVPAGKNIKVDPDSPIEVEVAHQWASGNYDMARAILQKFAYGMVGKGVSEDDKARFRTLMTEFALDDPLYREVMAKLKPIVLAQPGILQSAVYASLPEYDQETVRYVAYFGHEIGDIHRRKKGRSYELLPPGAVIDMPD